jgi:hypothetical protein
MLAKKSKSRGSSLAERLFAGIHDAEAAPLPGARDLPVLTGVGRAGEFLVPQENVLVRATDILVQSGKVFLQGDAIVQEIDPHDGTGPRLIPLRTGGRVEVGAEDWLANLFICELGRLQFSPPRALVDVLLRAETTVAWLPRVRVYARGPVFDENFVLQGPGWHPEVGILVHGPAIDPVPVTSDDTDGSALNRLPTHLRRLLQGFCFTSDADCANAVGFMATGLLANHFIERSKPVGLLDGNQPGVGKTLLARAMGMVLGGTDPRLIHFTPDDEELQKRICATLRDGKQAILLIDNAKVRGGGVVDSPVIEANSMAPEVSLRILGRSEHYTQPNTLLWVLTMNDTRTSPDLVSRGLPIRQSHEGDPRDRVFEGPDPVEYAREHRLDILGELAGMVVRWNQQGRPPGSRGHRCGYWAQVVGGILETAGLPEFLENAGEAAVAFDSALDALAALAEAAVVGNGAHVVIVDNSEGVKEG